LASACSAGQKKPELLALIRLSLPILHAHTGGTPALHALFHAPFRARAVANADQPGQTTHRKNRCQVSETAVDSQPATAGISPVSSNPSLIGVAMFAKRILVLATLVAAAAQVHAYDSKATIAELDTRLAKIGAPRLEGTDAVGGKDVPAIFFGSRKINNNFDVVDGLRKTHQATATVFVKSGDEFVRVSTNVLTPEGKRGVGTQLARNAAYAAVSAGNQYCGPIDVLGTAFDACYNPIKDGAGAIIGVSYIGHKK
jgi:hypothetical protein